MKNRMMLAGGLAQTVLVMGVALLVSGTSHAFTIDPNVPKDVATQLKADLVFMGSIQGDQTSALHQKIYGAMEGKNYQKFFESRVTAIGLDGCGDGNAVACVIPYASSSKMWITQNYIKFSHPQIARLMVVYHEARHTEVKNDNWPHASCPVPFVDENGHEIKSIWTGASLAGEDACDETPFGSYGSSTILLKNVSEHCKTCTEKVKMDAGIYADDQMGRIISAEAKQEMKKDLGYR